MRWLVNIITFSRLIASPALLLAEPFSYLFYIIYAYCGLSDLADGWIARKARIQSQVGAALDSMADMVFFGISAIIWVPRVHLAYWALWWVGTLLVFRGISMLICFGKYQILIPFLHTNMNKFAGFLLYFMPFAFMLPSQAYVNYAIIFLGAVSAVATFEEVSIHLLSDRLVRDIPTIFCINVNKI